MLKNLVLADHGSSGWSLKEKRLYALVSFFFAAIYMPGISWLYNAAMWAVFVFSFFYNPPAEKMKLLKQRPALVGIIAFFILNCISALLSNNVSEGISWVGIRISLFAFPMAIGSIYIRPAMKDRLIFSFAFITSIAGAGALLHAGWLANKNGDASLLYNDNLSDSINLQSVYFALLVNIAVFCYAYLLLKKSSLIKTKQVIPLLLLLAVLNFLLASRVGILFLYSTILIGGLYLLFTKRKPGYAAALVSIFLVGGLALLYFFPKTINRFKELGYTHFTYSSQAKESHFNMVLTAEQWNGANIRMAIWQCAWAVTKQHMVWGTGIGDKMDDLKKQYAAKGFVFAIKNNRNVHNNYLDVWMTLGLVGLILFLTGFFILPIADCYRYKDWLGIIILTGFAFSLISETYIDRTAGNTFLSYFISFIYSYKRKE